MHIQRIENAIDTMNDVHARIIGCDPKASFDMNSWGYGDICGTTACAGGWMALDPWHQSQGLKPLRPDAPMPLFEGEIGSDALARYLDIPHDDSRRIFDWAMSESGTPILTPLDVVYELKCLLAREPDPDLE